MLDSNLETMIPVNNPPVGGGGDRRRLNTVDRTLLTVDRTLRQMGFPGFETQTFVWLHSTVDAARLRAALARLGRRYPVLTARLMDSEGTSPYWQLPSVTKSPILHEAELGSAVPQEVLEYAGRMLSTPSDPAHADPIRFHLLHRPGGRDVFLMQYNHALMEPNDVVPLLRQLDHFANCSSPVEAAPSTGWRDPIRAYLRGYQRQRRRTAFRATAQLLSGQRGRVIQLGRDVSASTGRTQLRIASRRFGPLQTQAIESRVLRLCGFPSLSMAILGSAFRALWQLASRPNAAEIHLATALGIDIRRGKPSEPTLHNMTSLLPVLVRPENLEDRDGLTLTLSRQLRERLASDIDVGMLELTTLLGRQPRRARWIVEFGLRHTVSLWYGYFGALDGMGQQFCGTPVKDVYSAGPSWAPMGLTLLANQFAGQLFLQATYVSDSVPDSLANEFLDMLQSDLED